MKNMFYFRGIYFFLFCNQKPDFLDTHSNFDRFNDWKYLNVIRNCDWNEIEN